MTSRIGIEAAAEAVEPGSDLGERVERLVASGAGILVIDEAQFASVDQVDALARLVDDHGVDVHAFGLSADFRQNLFPGSARLFAIADWAHELPLTSSCWCGAKGRCNARVVNGVVAREGDQFLHRRRQRRRRALRGALPHPLPARTARRRRRGLEEGGAELVELARARRRWPWATVSSGARSTRLPITTGIVPKLPSMTAP